MMCRQKVYWWRALPFQKLFVKLLPKKIVYHVMKKTGSLDISFAQPSKTTTL